MTLPTPQPLMSKYAHLLNALDEMQQSVAYAVRKSVLWEAETTIVKLEQQLATVTQERDELKYRLQAWNDIAAEAKHE